jgi:hypothetical protein
MFGNTLEPERGGEVVQCRTATPRSTEQMSNSSSSDFQPSHFLIQGNLGPCIAQVGMIISQKGRAWWRRLKAKIWITNKTDRSYVLDDMKKGGHLNLQSEAQISDYLGMIRYTMFGTQPLGLDQLPHLSGLWSKSTLPMSRVTWRRGAMDK